MTDNSSWEKANLERIQHRLKPLHRRSQEIIFDHRTGGNRVIVIKGGTQIQMYFMDPEIASHTLPAASGVMSRIDIKDPLNLLGVYTQALILSLIWSPNPKQVHVLGFGGGRVPMIFHHYFPETIIESTDVEPCMTEVSEQFFGITFDERQILKTIDGRQYLAQRSRDAAAFDIIIIDAFLGTGFVPYELATNEFYSLVKDQLSPSGVACSYLLDLDPLFIEKVNTFVANFENCYFWSFEGSYIMFGSNSAPINATQRADIAQTIQTEHNFVFPFLHHLGYLKHFDEMGAFKDIVNNAGAELLSDLSPPLDKLQSRIPITDPIFYNAQRNSPCPCGSGLKYKHCHGSSHVRTLQKEQSEMSER